jgi:hypothetical protein
VALDNSSTIGVSAGTCELAVTLQLDPLVEIGMLPVAPAALIVQASPIVLPFVQPVEFVALAEGINS